VFLAALTSYAGAPMRPAAPLIVAAALGISAAGAILAGRAPRRAAIDWHTAACVHGAGLVGGASTLLAVALYHAWNPYTDAFTYISIADYLQQHSYFTPAIPDATHPLLTQTWLYQHYGFRMGSNFALALLTGAFRREYAFDVYPTCLALGVCLGAPAMWTVCRRGLFMRSGVARLAAAIYALHLGVPIPNALSGFLPQAWGYAFVLPAAALHIQASRRGDVTRRLVAAGALLALVLLTYTEIVPFLLAGVGTCYAGRLFARRMTFRRAVIGGFAPIGLAIVIAPLAGWTFLRVIATQYRALGGWDVHLGLFDYMLMLAGFRSIMQDLSVRPGAWPFVLRITAIAVSATAVYASIRGPARMRRQVGALGLVFLVSLAWFGLYVVNRWQPGSVGEPWTTYKTVTYSFFLFAALWASGLALIWQRVRALRLLVVAQLAVFVVYFPMATLDAAGRSISAMRVFTNGAADPIADYKRLPSLVAAIRPDEPINVVVPPEAMKHRQMIAYFLRRPIIADWSNDDFVGEHLPPGSNAPIDPKHSTLVYTPDVSPPGVANMTLRRYIQVPGAFGSGWHGREQDSQGHVWYWLEEAGEIEVTTPNTGWLWLQGDLAVVGAPERTITIAIRELPDRARSYRLTERWFVPFAAERIQLPAGHYHVMISADGPVHAMGPNDDRLVRMGVRDFTWALTPE
jgi:hypothetical protein